MLLQHLLVSGESVLLRSCKQPCSAGSRRNSKHLTRTHYLAAARKVRAFASESSSALHLQEVAWALEG